MGRGAVQMLMDDVVVGALLLGSIGYVLFSLGPRALRGRVLAVSAGLLLRLRVRGLRSLAQRLEAASAMQSSGSCGGCGTCESKQPPPGAAPTSDTEVRIAASAIGKRNR